MTSTLRPSVVVVVPMVTVAPSTTVLTPGDLAGAGSAAGAGFGKVDQQVVRRCPPVTAAALPAAEFGVVEGHRQIDHIIGIAVGAGVTSEAQGGRRGIGPDQGGAQAGRHVADQGGPVRPGAAGERVGHRSG